MREPSLNLRHGRNLIFTEIHISDFRIGLSCGTGFQEPPLGFGRLSRDRIGIGQDSFVGGREREIEIPRRAAQKINRKRRIQGVLTHRKSGIGLKAARLQKSVPHLVGIEKDAFEYILSGSVPPQSGFRLTYLQQCLLGLALKTGHLECLGGAREVHHLVRGVAGSVACVRHVVAYPGHTQGIRGLD